MGYIIKHIESTNAKRMRYRNMKTTNIYLKYYSNIDLKHYVFDIEEATQFETKKRAKNILNKFKYPELWEVVRIKDEKKEQR